MFFDIDEEPTNFHCLRVCIVILGTISIVAAAFVLYFAVQPFEREEEGQNDLPFFSPEAWSIGGTLVAVFCLLSGGLCILCGFFGCPTPPDDMETYQQTDDFINLQNLLQSALIARELRAQDNEFSNSEDEEESN